MIKIKKFSKLMPLILIVAMLAMISMTGCSEPVTTGGSSADNVEVTVVDETENVGVPKYVFLFIGDGMSFPQLSALGYYDGTIEHDFSGTLAEPTPDNPPQAEMPSFTEFPVVGSSTTYDASKFVTDSASAATALATGTKTLDGIIGQDSYNNDVPSIAELLHQDGFKVGIITSVSIDHATPAAFYAHQASRNNYYDISLQMIDSGFEYFGGGGFYMPNGPEGDMEKSIFDQAKEAGMTVATTKEEILAVDGNSGRVLASNPILDAMNAIPYRIDLDHMEDADKSVTLDQYVEKGLDVLGDADPFFMMVESGKVDWACHSNDAITCIKEVVELENAVNVALKFADAHPGETLIVVTGDHETGGFSNGYQGTEYDTYFDILSAQNASSDWLKSNVVNKYIENGVTYDQAMDDIKKYFGLIRPDDPDAADAANPAMVLTEGEVKMFEAAYLQTMIPEAERDLRAEEYRKLYGTYRAEPILITATHIINNKAGIGWSSTSHSALPTAVFAYGTGSENFGGFYDNTDVFLKFKNLLGV